MIIYYAYLNKLEKFFIERYYYNEKQIIYLQAEGVVCLPPGTDRCKEYLFASTLNVSP